MQWILLILVGIVHAQTFATGLIPQFLLAPVQLLCMAFVFLCIWRAQNTALAIKRVMVFSISSFCAGTYWLFISMNVYGNLPTPLAALAVFLLAVYLSFYPAISVAVFRYLKPSSAMGMALVFAAAWALGEWLRATVFTGFPWLTIAYAHVDSPLASWAAIWGAYGVSFLAALCAALLALACFYRKTVFAVWMFAIMLLGSGLSLIPWSKPIGEPLSVRLIQGNVDQRDKFDPTLRWESFLRHFDLAALPFADPQHPAQVVIFPETIVPTFQYQLPLEMWRGIVQQAKSQNTEYWLGVPYVMEKEGEPLVSNSIIRINGQTNADDFYKNDRFSHYDKSHLVPFGEYIPYGFRWLVDAIGIPLGDFSPGQPPQANFEIAGQALAPNICYEDVFGEELIPALFDHAVPKRSTAISLPENPMTVGADNGQISPGASILFNISNLGWFGHSSALGQHLQMARMRAIETARPMLRATNTGATAYIDERGNVRASLPYLSEGVLDVSVQGMSGLTPYAYVKNWAMLVVVVFLLLWVYVKNNNIKHQ